MAEIATIARPYAEALFKASNTGGAPDSGSTTAWIDELAVIAASAQLQQFADNPTTTVEQLFGVITGVARSALPDAAKNFLRAVIENGRLTALPEIAAQFRALENARGGTSDAVVYSAFPMDSAALAGVASMLEKHFARKLNIRVEQEPALIGGIRVEVGDEVLDTSVKARLEQMRVALIA